MNKFPKLKWWRNNAFISCDIPLTKYNENIFMLACLVCLPFMNDEVYQGIIFLHIVWGRIKPLKCSISVNDLEIHKNINYYSVKDVLVFSGSWRFVFVPLVMECGDDCLQRQKEHVQLNCKLWGCAEESGFSRLLIQIYSNKNGN